MFQAESGSTTKSLIWRDMEVKGDITSKGALRVDGRHIGNIKCTTLEIGEQAEVTGNVSATEIVISGKVNGEMRVMNLVIRSSAHVEGKVIYKTVTMEEGAILEGDLQRQENPVT